MPRMDSQEKQKGERNPDGSPQVFVGVKVWDEDKDRLRNYQAFFQLREGRPISLAEAFHMVLDYAPKYRLAAEEIIKKS